MLTPGFLLKALPIVAFVLAAFLFFVIRALSRFKSGDEKGFAGARFGNSRAAAATPKEIERLSGVFPAVVATDNGSFEAEAKDISLAGAFIVCAEPLAVGERLTVSLQLQEPLTLQAAVTWNNRNVPAAEVVARGMRVRFLDISPEARQALGAPRP